MKNEPKQIFLNIGADGQCENFNDTDEVTWSPKRINDDDIEYINKYEFDELKEEYDAMIVSLQDTIAERNTFKDLYNDLKLS